MSWVCKYCNLKKECAIKRENGEYIDISKCEDEYYNEQEKEYERLNDK